MPTTLMCPLHFPVCPGAAQVAKSAPGWCCFSMCPFAFPLPVPLQVAVHRLPTFSAMMPMVVCRR